MNKFKIYIFIIFTLHLMQYQNVFAQNFSEDMRQVQAIILKQPLSYNVNYNLFSSHKAGVLVQHKEADLFMWEDLFSYRSDELVIINNEKYAITTDHTQKVVLINKANPSVKKSRMKEMAQLANDSNIKKVASFTLIMNTDAQRQWRVIYKRPIGGIQFMDITISLPEFYIKKMTIYYARTFSDLYGTSPDGVNESQKPRMEIDYQNYKTISTTDKQKAFHANDIVLIDKSGKAKLNGNYKNYKLANYYKYKS